MKTQEIANRLTEIYQGEPWFGESLQTKLENVSADMAYHQPAPDKHSIAEILSHMAYWRKSFIHELKGDTSVSFSGDSADNWRTLSDLKKQGWENQLKDFDETQTQLIHLLQNLTDKFIDEALLNNLTGLVNHDIYHIGQIGFVKSLVKALPPKTKASVA